MGWLIVAVSAVVFAGMWGFAAYRRTSTAPGSDQHRAATAGYWSMLVLGPIGLAVLVVAVIANGP